MKVGYQSSYFIQHRFDNYCNILFMKKIGFTRICCKKVLHWNHALLKESYKNFVALQGKLHVLSALPTLWHLTNGTWHMTPNTWHLIKKNSLFFHWCYYPHMREIQCLQHARFKKKKLSIQMKWGIWIYSW